MEGYLTDSAYRYFLSVVPSIQNMSSTLSFSSFYYKGVTMEGQCSTWTQYATTGLSIPSSNLYFSKITFASKYNNFDTRKSAGVQYTCTNTYAIGNIVSSLISGREYEFNCDGNSWRVFTCDSNPVMCVNCKMTCQPSATCPGNTFTINPCLSSCNVHASAASAVGFTYSFVKKYPVFVSPLNVSALSSTALRVAVNASVYNYYTVGTIYCAAVMKNLTLSSTQTIVSSGSRAKVLGTGYVAVVVSGLSPDTAYNVYCYTEALDVYTMPLSEVLSSKATGHTLCCRNAYFSVTYPSVGDILNTPAANQPFFTLSLDTMPLYDLTVSIKFTTFVCPSSLRMGQSKFAPQSAASPSSFTFPAFTTQLSRTFIVQGYQGCYSVSTIPSSAGNEYFASNSVTLYVQDRRTTPPAAPVLLSAVFTSDGSGLYFNFDSVTNVPIVGALLSGGVFSCGKLVNFTGSNSSLCRWTSPQQLLVTFNSGATNTWLHLGDVVTLRGGLITGQCLSASCSSYPKTTNITLSVQAPTSPVTPLVSLVTKSAYGACENITLNPLASSGSCHRSWARVSWSINADNCISQNCTIIEEYLNRYYNSTSSVALFPRKLVFAGPDNAWKYYVTLTLTNYFGVSASSTATVSFIGNNTVPTLSLSATGSITRYRWQPVSVSALALYSSCFKTPSQTLTFTWAVYNGVKLVTELRSSSLDPRQLYVPPFRLNASTTYLVKVTVAVGPNPGLFAPSATASVQVVIGPTLVVAAIDGGTTRSIIVKNAVILDASISADKGYPGASLTYSWACVSAAPSYGGSCGVSFTSSSSVLSFPGKSFKAGRSYLFTVTATNVFGQSGTATVNVTAFSSNVPVLIMGAVATKYNPADKIVLSGQVTGTNVSLANWTASSLSRGQLSKLVSTPLSVTAIAGVSTVQLLISAGALTPGLSYVFTLAAGYIFDTTTTQSTTVTVVMNSPPVSGVLSVAPLTGESLTTSFAYQASEWTDDPSDYPFSYTYGYTQLLSLPFTLVQSRSPNPQMTGIIGQGMKSTGYTVFCVLYVYDYFGCPATATTNVVVKPPSNSTALLVAMHNNISRAFAASDVTTVVQLMTAVQSSLVQVNCLAAPNCTTLHRKVCAQTPNTCGACLRGYVGPRGDGNTLCQLLSLSSNARSQALPTTQYQLDQTRRRYLLASNGESCSSSSDCTSNICSAVAGTGICVDIPTECPNACSGNGTCVSYDISGDIASVNCTASNPFCYTKCVCIPGRHGRDCSLTLSAYSTSKSLRESLALNLWKVYYLQDASIETNLMRANSILNIYSDYTLVSSEAAAACSLVLYFTVTDTSVNACDPATASLLYDTINAMLQARGALNATVYNRLIQSFFALNEQCRANMVAGQQAEDYSSTILSVSSAIGTAQTLLSEQVFVPQSEYAAANSVTQSYISSLDIASTSSVSVSVAAFQLAYEFEKAETVSIPVGFFGDAFIQQRDGRDAVATSISFEVYLQNKNLVKYLVANESEYREVYCNRTYSSYIVNATPCTNGLELQAICPGVPAVYNFTCPKLNTRPVCTLWDSDSSSYVADSSCSVVEYGDDFTLCRCEGLTLSTDSGDRRSLVTAGQRRLSSNGNFYKFSSEVSSYTTVLVTQLAYGPKPTNPEHSQVIFGFLMALIVCLIAGVMIFIQVDLREFAEAGIAKDAHYKAQRSIEEFVTQMIPIEFLHEEPWSTKLVRWIQLEHNWLSLFAKYNLQKTDFRTARYLLAWGKLCVYLFVDTVVAFLFYSDNGACEDVRTKDSCDQQESPLHARKLCHWDSELEYCMYTPPPLTFNSMLVLILVIIVIGVPLNKMVELLVREISKSLRIMARNYSKKVLIDNIVTAARGVKLRAADVVDGLQEYWNPNDELRDVQTFHSKILTGARLANMQENMDFVMPHLEAEKLLEITAKEGERFGRDELIVKKSLIDLSAQKTNVVKHNRYSLVVGSKHDVRNRIMRSRAVAINVRREIEALKSVNEKEEYLLKIFIIDLFAGFRRLLVERLLLYNYVNTARNRHLETVSRWFSIIALPVVFGVMLYLIFSFQVSIGSRATTSWLIIVAVSVLQDILLLQPIKIWLKYVLINSLVSPEVRKIFDIVRIRFKHVITRQARAISDSSSALVQHFNPACRVARTFPHLPVARFLMCLNDYDFPHFRRLASAKANAPRFIRWLEPVGIGLLALLMMLPHHLQDCVVDIVNIGVVNVLGVILYSIGRINIIAGILVALALLIALTYLGFLMYRRFLSTHQEYMAKRIKAGYHAEKVGPETYSPKPRDLDLDGGVRRGSMFSTASGASVNSRALKYRVVPFDATAGTIPEDDVALVGAGAFSEKMMMMIGSVSADAGADAKSIRGSPSARARASGEIDDAKDVNIFFAGASTLGGSRDVSDKDRVGGSANNVGENPYLAAQSLSDGLQQFESTVKESIEDALHELDGNKRRQRAAKRSKTRANRFKPTSLSPVRARGFHPHVSGDASSPHSNDGSHASTPKHYNGDINNGKEWHSAAPVSPSSSARGSSSDLQGRRRTRGVWNSGLNDDALEHPLSPVNAHVVAGAAAGAGAGAGIGAAGDGDDNVSTSSSYRRHRRQQRQQRNNNFLDANDNGAADEHGLGPGGAYGGGGNSLHSDMQLEPSLPSPDKLILSANARSNNYFANDSNASHARGGDDAAARPTFPTWH
jgi:hypothetical protein